MRRALLAVSMLLASAAGAGPLKKREAPAPVAPVVADGIRYEVLAFGKARGLPQNGGYVLALDAATGRELWLSLVYEVPPADGEGDKADVFITALTLRGTTLLVETERGRRYRLDLHSRLSRPD